MPSNAGRQELTRLRFRLRRHDDQPEDGDFKSPVRVLSELTFHDGNPSDSTLAARTATEPSRQGTRTEQRSRSIPRNRLRKAERLERAGRVGAKEHWYLKAVSGVKPKQAVHCRHLGQTLRTVVHRLRKDEREPSPSRTVFAIVFGQLRMSSHHSRIGLDEFVRGTNSAPRKQSSQLPRRRSLDRHRREITDPQQTADFLEAEARLEMLEEAICR